MSANTKKLIELHAKLILLPLCVAVPYVAFVVSTL